MQYLTSINLDKTDKLIRVALPWKCWSIRIFFTFSGPFFGTKQLGRGVRQLKVQSKQYLLFSCLLFTKPFFAAQVSVVIYIIFISYINISINTYISAGECGPGRHHNRPVHSWAGSRHRTILRCTKGKRNYKLLFLYDDIVQNVKRKKWRPILLNSHTFGSDFDDDVLTAPCIMRCKEKLP